MPGEYRLITTDDATQTLAEGTMSQYDTLLDAAKAFIEAEQPYRQIVVDNERDPARALNDDEEQQVAAICLAAGYDLLELDGDVVGPTAA